MNLRSAFFAAAAAALVSPAGAASHPRPRASIALPAVIEAGSPFTASWRASGVPHGARVLVQKPVGTGHVWKALAPALTGRSGTVTLPAYSSLGIYRLRIAITLHGRVLASQQVSAHVFATVPLEQLVPGPEIGVVATSSAAFPYILRQPIGTAASGGAHEGTHAVYSSQRSDCDRIHLDFVGEPEEPQRAGAKTASATIVQQAAEPVGATVPLGQIASIETPLAIGQSWALSLAVKLVSPEIFGYVYINGTAHCDAKTLLTAL